MTHPTWALALIAVLAGAPMAGARAQSVTMFGLVDVAVEHVTRVAPSGGSINRMPSLTGSFPSRLGIRATEDLGDGLRAVVVLEQGFAPDMGTFTQGGRAFGRQSLVGLTGPWGSVTLGRQYTMLYWALLDADVIGPALYGTGSLDAYIPNARADNAIAYRGTFSGLTVGATFSLGRDAVNAGSAGGTNCAGEGPTDPPACRELSALLKYDSPAFGAALAWDQIHGGTGAFAGLTSGDRKDTRISLNGYAQLGPVKGTLGLVRRDNGGVTATPRSDLWYVGAVWPVQPNWVIDGEWLRLSFNDSPNRATLAVARATYALSRRSAVYAMAGRIGNGGSLALSVSAGAGGSSPVAGGSQAAFALGLRHSF
jgi:predicted porin